MNIKITNHGASKILCPVNRDGSIPLLPGCSIDTYTDEVYLEKLKKLEIHKITVESDGKFLVGIKKKPKPKRKIKEVSINTDTKLLLRIAALKSGINNINRKLRHKIIDLEFRLENIITTGGKDISQFMNVLKSSIDEESKLAIFKRVIEDNLKIRENL